MNGDKPVQLPTHLESLNKHVAARISVCVAEYSALNSRATSYIGYQAGLWTLILLFLGVAASLWGRWPQSTLLWSGCIVVQAVLAGIVAWTGEQYLIIRYLERHLLPEIRTLLPGAESWGYERYLADMRRGKWQSWEYGPPFLGGCVVAVATWLAHPVNSLTDSVLAMVALLILGATFVRARELITMRLGIFS